MRFWSVSQAAIVSVLLLTGCGDTAVRHRNVRDSEPSPSPVAANPADTGSTSGLSPSEAPAGNDKPPTEKEIINLIQQLVSPNRAPDVTTYGRAKDPERL